MSDPNLPPGCTDRHVDDAAPLEECTCKALYTQRWNDLASEGWPLDQVETMLEAEVGAQERSVTCEGCLQDAELERLYWTYGPGTKL